MFNFQDGGAVESIGWDAANTRGTAVANSGVANTKSGWVQLVAATARDARGILAQVHANDTVGAAAALLFDLGIGGAGAEQVLVPNALDYFCSAAGGDGTADFFFPISVPAGSRVSARFQGSNTTVNLRFALKLLQQGLIGMPSYGRLKDYGSVTGTSSGSVVDPGGVANTKSAWVQLSAATGSPIEALALNARVRNSASPGAQWVADIGVGGAGAEQIIVPDLYIPSRVRNSPALPCFIPVTIPAGTRLSVRAQSDNITAGQREMDCNILGAD